MSNNNQSKPQKTAYCASQMQDNKRVLMVALIAAFLVLHCRYVTALNNLGDAYEKAQQQKDALSTYEEVLNYAPGNKVASSRVDALRQRV